MRLHLSRQPVRTAALSASLLLLAAGCSSGPDPLEATPVVTTEVSVVDNAYEPIAIEVPIGEPVTWTWEGSARHDVVGEGFGSELQTDGSFTRSFDQVGLVEYRCTIHGGMRGVIRVVEG